MAITFFLVVSLIIIGLYSKHFDFFVYKKTIKHILSSRGELYFDTLYDEFASFFDDEPFNNSLFYEALESLVKSGKIIYDKDRQRYSLKK